MSDKPTLSLPQHLLWEYDLEKFDYERQYRIVIERVVERGTLEELQAVLHFYGRDRFASALARTRGLSRRNAQFAELFLQSKLSERGYRL